MTRGIALVVLTGVVAGCGASGAATLPFSAACVTVRSNVTSITNQAEADEATGSLSRAAHDFTAGAAQIRHDVALLNPSDPVAVATRQIAVQVAKVGRKLATEARRKGDSAAAPIPNIKTGALTAACS